MDKFGFLLLGVFMLAMGTSAELMSRMNDDDDGDYWIHQKRLSHARHTLNDAISALERLSASPVVSNGRSMIDTDMLDSVKRSAGSMARVALEEEKRVCLVNLSGACQAEDALRNAKMRAFLESANGPGRR